MDFDTDKTFYTETMARLLARQGRCERAADVYRHLLKQSPHRKDLEQALEDVLSAIPPLATARWETTRDLIERWIRLILRYRALRQLRHLPMDQFRGERP